MFLIEWKEKARHCQFLREIEALMIEIDRIR